LPAVDPVVFLLIAGGIGIVALFLLLWLRRR
jgi:hypothetical protein